MIKLSIQDGAKLVSLETDRATDEHVSMALRGAFGIFGFTGGITRQQMASESTPPVSNHLKAKQAQEVAAAKKGLEPAVAPEETTEPVQGKERPRAVELIGSQRSLQVPIAEVTENPEWWLTGIKVKDGVPHYRTRYFCKNRECRHKGNQYVRIDADSAECHNCGTQMGIRPATGVVGEDGIPEIDQFGNFFIADKLMEANA